MNIVPVIDLLAGRAVRAHAGQRDRYLPIDSPLCRDGDALTLVARLLDACAATRLYIADLDAIEGRGDHRELLEQITRRHPTVTLWLDAGFDGPAAIEAIRNHIRCRPVVGSESWRDPAAPPTDSLLSIDRDAEGLRDPSGLAVDPARHPRDLILMNLTRVGSNSGPDLSQLEQHAVTARHDTRLYLAGGVRDIADLHAAKAAGAAGVLLASALHNGRITPADVASFN